MVQRTRRWRPFASGPTASSIPQRVANSSGRAPHRRIVPAPGIGPPSRSQRAALGQVKPKRCRPRTPLGQGRECAQDPSSGKLPQVVGDDRTGFGYATAEELSRLVVFQFLKNRSRPQRPGHTFDRQRQKKVALPARCENAALLKNTIAHQYRANSCVVVAASVPRRWSALVKPGCQRPGCFQYVAFGD